ncbi:protein kinase [Acidobacteriota bacterium]
MKCPQCHSENPNTKQFCGDCGTSLVDAAEVLVPQTKTLISPAVSKGKLFAGKYKIIEEIGRGGMGIVYKAKDIKLKRNVALKFLPSELMQDKKAKARFLQEAQAAAALNHPNICIIHEVDDSDDQTFIAMEYIEGQTLKDKIDSGPLEIDDAVKITTQVAEGLAEAHAKGIVHRDIKPANIMLTDKGTAKIMDFGIAKLAAGVDLTQPSTLIGTVAYMSPEQARGDEVDQRTDIWSLGAMFYEMLTGDRPFQKSQEQALIYAILHDSPTPVSLLRSDIPTHVEKVIEKALAKKVGERYQDILELIQDLKLSITPIKTEKSIVVLPFDDMSPGKDNEYFSDGLTEEIISDLSLIHDLLVISRSSAMTYKGTKKKIKEIGKELNVQYVLEGSVRKAGSNLRITAQLINATKDTHIWANKYSGTLDDVFDIQEKVSRSIVDALSLKLGPKADNTIAERPIDNIKAYEFYLKANSETFKFTEEAINQAIQNIHHALDIIGDNVLLYSSMAYAHFHMVNIGAKQEDYLVKAENYVNKALSLDPDHPKALAAQGHIYFLRDPLKSVIYLKKALNVNPDDSNALVWLSAVYIFWAGKISAAIPLCEKYMRTDPFDYMSQACSSSVSFYNGQFDQAYYAWKSFYEKYPDNPYNRFWYALILIYQNEIDSAFSIIDQSVNADSDNVLVKMSFLLKYAYQHNKAKAFKVMTPEFIQTCKRDGTYSHHIAGFMSLLDEKKRALDWLETAIDGGFINYPLLSKQDPFLDNIRGDPRFKKLMERVKHEWENFEV